MRPVFSYLLLGAALVSMTTAQAATIPDLHVDLTVATEGPLSLWSVPDGSGLDFTEAYRADGSQVDGTITLVLYVNDGGGLEPVANYPHEDIWLEGLGPGLAPCNGGTCPDAATDATGTTTWVQPMRLGGQTRPELEEGVWAVVNGDFVEGGALPSLRLNSPDINGDRIVNLTDIQLFSDDFYGAYDYRSDFVWDGIVNLSDLVPLAITWGVQCP